MARVAVITGASRALVRLLRWFWPNTGTGWSSTIAPVHPRPRRWSRHRRSRWRSRGD